MELTMQNALDAYGVDVPTVVARFGGNEALYLKYLLRFPQDSTYQQLEAALQRGARAEAADACHTLKGISGNLGLTPLYTACTALTSALRAEETAEVSVLWNTLRETYQSASALCTGLSQP